MVCVPCPPLRPRSNARVAGTIVALLLACAPGFALAGAQSDASVSSQLAADTARLATAQTELVAVRADLRRSVQRHRKLRAGITRRMVAIYRSGGAVESFAQVAAGGSVRDLGRTLDALDIVNRHQERQLREWRELNRRTATLRERRDELEATIADAERDVSRGRNKLLRAQHAAELARASAAEMSHSIDSPIVTRVGHPETSAVRAADSAIGRPDAGAADWGSQPLGFRQTGVASMYSDSFTGERTANGETYDPNAFTAAHPSLPFGTWVTVHAPGGTIVVRINDRGPFVGGRIIDLSRAAATAAGLSGGIAQVTLTVDA